MVKNRLAYVVARFFPAAVLVGDYASASLAVILRRRRAVGFADLLLSFYPWLSSIRANRNALADGRPWITFSAERYLATLLSQNSRVFEFGAGGSTIYFATRVTELSTAEHDAGWLDRTSHQMSENKPRATWRPHLAPATRGTSELPSWHPESYKSSDPAFTGFCFRDYASAIDQYPAEYFDLVLIDGRARPSCFKHSITKVKVGGYIVLDNAEREEYGCIEDWARRLGFETTEFWGPGPYNRYFWRTLFFRKVRSGFGLNELDSKLDRYINEENGIFVEAGANDGVTQSNTLYLELYRGWTGLLIEPVPQLAELCRRYRGRAVVEEAALVSTEYHKKTITLRYANLMSVVKGGMKSSHEEDAHILAGMRAQNLETYEFQSPAVTLSALIDRHGLERIDLLSLDVEGYELDALKGLDLERHAPAYILVEARYRDEVHTYLNSRYDMVAQLSHHDYLYRLRRDASDQAPTPDSGERLSDITAN